MISLVAYDWNGTVLSDHDAAVAGFAEVLRLLGDDREATYELHSAHLHFPIKEMYASLGYQTITKDEHKKLSHAWLAEYCSYNQTHGIQLSPGIKESLDYLDEKSIRRVVLSNFTVDEITRQLGHLDIDFDTILANREQHDNHGASKLDRLQTYLDEHDIPPEQAVIIGDSVEEPAVAQALGVKSISVSNGWTTGDRLKIAEPDYLVNTSELKATLKAIHEG